jgi:hypothetical protein
LVFDFEQEFYRTSGTTSTFFDSITHARSGNATMVDESGLLKWAPHNLLTYSEQFDNAAWAKTSSTVTANAATAPDGTAAAEKITPSAVLGFQHGVDAILALGGSYNVSIYAKAAEYSFLVIALNNSSSTAVSFNLLTGEVGSNPSAYAASIEGVGDGWFRCNFSFTPGTGNNRIRFIARNDATVANWTPDGTSGIFIWGAQLYRSDLGGMVNNPDTGNSYVPTTSAARYLPRRGHHVYNGSEWVNEGLLVESEARTNLDANSNTFTAGGNTTVTANQSVSPSGSTDAALYDENTASVSNAGLLGTHTTVAATTYTSSVFVKYVSGSGIVALTHRSNNSSNQFFAWFDVQSGIKLTLGAGTGTMTAVDSGIEDWGDGWYRIWTVGTDSTQTTANPVIISASSDGGTARETDAQFYIWQSQFEAGSVPSSLIPTSGATVTRPADTLTVPSANLPWPSPVVIGEELIPSDLSTVFVDRPEITATSTDIVFNTTSSDQISSSIPGGVVGNMYLVSFEIYDFVSGTINLRFGNSGSNDAAGLTAGIYTYPLYLDTIAGIAFRAATSVTELKIRNISVREINPLAVSIQMDGRMTYADDDGDGTNPRFFQWRRDTLNGIDATNSTLTSRNSWVDFRQYAAGVVDAVSTNSNVYSSGINVPYNIASRHGSTFINGSVDGTALTADTTPTALPDLSATNLNLAFDYMGTIRTFRVWADDLGDTGITEATLPSLEPSLSLTFDGTEGSFTVLDWSE